MSKRLLPYVLGIGLGISSIFGCREEVVEYSKVLHEDAVVADVVYSPSNHGSGSGIGPTMDFDGNIGLAFTSVDIDVPEKYAVVFKCKHGKFVVQGEGKAYKSLWEKMIEGQKVDVTYQEKYKSTYDDVNDDDKNELVDRVLTGYKFLDAQAKE